MATTDNGLNGETTSHATKPPTGDDSSVPTAESIIQKFITTSGPLVVPEFEHNEKKRKKEKEPRGLVRKRRKEEQNEKARANAAAKREQAIEEGTFDYEAEERQKKERHVNILVKRNIDKRLKAGEFGPVLPHPSSQKGGPIKKFFDPSTGKTLSYKAEKYKREKNKRIAQRAEKVRLLKELYPELAPPTIEDGATQEEVDAYEREQKDKKKASRKAKAQAKEAEDAEKERLHQQQLEEKKERRKERLEQKAKTEAGIAEMKARKAAEQAVQDAANQERWANEAQIEAEEKAKRDAKKEAKRLRREGGVLLPVESDGPNDFQTGADFVSLSAVPNTSAPAIQPVNGTSNSSQAASTSSVGNAPAVNGSTNEPKIDLNADEIKLGVTNKGRVKKIPGVGPVDKYPTKAEKRQKKLESKAFEAGLTLEDYQAKLDREKDERERPERERIAEVQASRGGLTAKEYRRKIAIERDAAANAIYLATGQYPQPGTYDPAEIAKMADLTTWEPKEVNWDEELPADAVTSEQPKVNTNHIDIEQLSEKKKRQYAAKAEEKGMTMEAYIEQRNKKKAKLAAEPPTDAANENLAFVIDTKGDSSLGANAPPSKPDTLQFVIDTVGNKDLTNAKVGDKPPLRWHPDMLGDREVKELSKEERKARLEWMRARRAARHAAAGRNPMSKKERAKRKMERKMTVRNKLVYDILKDTGKPMDQKVSKEELMDARRTAKRQMREQKRVKRNKMIHRKNQKVTALISVGRV